MIADWQEKKKRKRPACPVCSQGFGWPELEQSGIKTYCYYCRVCGGLFDKNLNPKAETYQESISGDRKPDNPFYDPSNPGNYTS